MFSDTGQQDKRHRTLDTRLARRETRTTSIVVFSLTAPGEGVRGPQAEHSSLTGIRTQGWRLAGSLRPLEVVGQSVRGGSSASLMQDWKRLPRKRRE